MKTHKIYINSEEDNYSKKSLPLKVLFENFKVEEVKQPEEAELIIDFVKRKGQDFSHLKDKKILIISCDNLFFKKNLFSFIESFFNFIGLKNRKYSIMDKLSYLIPKSISSIPILSFFPRYDKILKTKDKNIYFITTNKLKIENNFFLPFFLHNYYNSFKTLLNKNKISSLNIEKKRFCAFVVSSNSSLERISFFKQLSKYKKVDSYGKVFKNIDSPIYYDWKENYKMFENYKFVICFENSFNEGYLTEKILNVFLGKSLPIYRGDPDIKKYFNTKSFINYDDYGSYKKMIAKIIELDKNDKEYLKVLNEPCFKENKVPKIFKEKEKELIKFYKKILKEN